MNFQKIYSHTLGLIVVFMLSALGSAFSQTTYFAKTSGEAQVTSTWGVNPDGSGASPANFNLPADSFIIGASRTITSGEDWKVDGTVIVENTGILSQGFGNDFEFDLILESGATAILRGTNANNKINPISLDLNSTVDYRNLDYGTDNLGAPVNAGESTGAFQIAWSYGNLKFNLVQSTDKVTTKGVDVDIRGNLIITRGQFSMYVQRPDPLPGSTLNAKTYSLSIGGNLIVDGNGTFGAYNAYATRVVGYDLDTVNISIIGDIINRGGIFGIPNGIVGTAKISCDNFMSISSGGKFYLSNNERYTPAGGSLPVLPPSNSMTINNKLTMEAGSFTLNETLGAAANVMTVSDVEVQDQGSMIVSKAPADGNSWAQIKNSTVIIGIGTLKGNAEYGSTARTNFSGGFRFISGNTDTTFLQLSSATDNLNGGQNNVVVQKGRKVQLTSNVFLGDTKSFTLNDTSFLLMEDFYIKHVGTSTSALYGRIVTNNQSLVETKHPFGFGTTDNNGALRGNRTTGSTNSPRVGNTFNAGTILKFSHPVAQNIGEQISGISVAEVLINTPQLTLGTGSLTIRDSLVYEPTAKRFLNNKTTGLFQLQANCKIVGLDEDSTQNERFLNRITINSNGNSYFLPLSDSTSTLGNDVLDAEIYFPTTIATPGAERFETILYAFDADKNTTKGCGDNISRNNRTGIGQVNDYFYYHIYEPGILANNEGNTTVDTITIPYHVEDFDNGYDTIGDPSNLIIVAYSRYDNGFTGNSARNENRWRPINNITVDEVNKTVTGTYQIGAHFLRDDDANGKAMHFALAGKPTSGNFGELVDPRPNYRVEGLTAVDDTFTVNLGQTYKFIETSIYENVTTWVFNGDVNFSNSNQDETDVIFNSPGTYEVKVIAENDKSLQRKSYFFKVLPVAIAAFTVDTTKGCIDSTFTFTSTSTEVDSVLYEITGPENFTSKLANPSFKLTAPGKYTVKLKAFNANKNDSITKTELIEVFDCSLPVAAFTQNKTGGCDAITVNFTNNSAKFDKSTWIFDGGTPQFSNNENQTVSYTKKGSFDVTLIVENLYGKDTLEIKGLINVVDCEAAFTSDVTEICPDGSVTFSNTSASSTSVEWTFPGGTPTTSTDENPTVTYATTGNYSVTLVATNEYGNKAITTTDYINVLDCDLPTMSFTNGDTSDCDSVQVTFTNTGTKFDKVLWIFEGGQPNTSTALNPTVWFRQLGQFDVTLIGENAYGKDTIIKADHISTLDCIAPVSKFASDITEGCTSFEVTFENKSFQHDSVAWVFEGGVPATSTLDNPVVTYANTGSFQVQLISINDNERDTLTVENYITALDCSLPTPLFTEDATTGCVDDVVTFTNESEKYTSLLWIFEGGSPATSTIESPMVTYPNVGTYTVELIATNQYGKDTVKKTSLITITDCDLPTVDFNASETTVCAPTNIVFSPDVEKGGTYLWTFEKGSGTPETSTLKNPMINYSIEGVYSVTLEVTNVNGTTTETKTDYITVNNCNGVVPVGGFDFEIVPQALVNFTNTSNVTGDDATYSWSFGDGTSKSADESPSHQFTADGSYDVTMIIRNNAGSDTVTKTVDIVGVSVANLINPEDIKVYPNPTNGVLTIETVANFENFEVKVMDITGKQLVNKISFGNNTQIDITALPAGTYILEVRSDDKFHRQLVIKQ